MPKRIKLPTPAPAVAAAPISSASMHPVLKYFLIFTLIILLGFTVIYIVNIVKHSNNMERFADVVSTSQGAKKFVLIYSTSCGHCKQFMTKWEPIVQEMAKKYPSVTFQKFEHNSPGAEQYMYNKEGVQITGFPTTLFVENDSIKETLVGNVNDAELISFVTRNST